MARSKSNTSDLANRMNDAAAQGGGVRPNSHPELDKPTPLDAVVGAAKSVSNWMRGSMNSTGSKRSPSTVRDAKPADHPSFTPAQEDSILNKAMRGGR